MNRKEYTEMQNVNVMHRKKQRITLDKKKKKDEGKERKNDD